MLPPLPPPPTDFLNVVAPAFVIAEGLGAWVREHLLDEASPIYNPRHAALTQAEIGYLWAREGAKSKGKRVIGTAEIFAPKGAGWTRDRQKAQVNDWFGAVPDFIITLDAETVAERLAAGDAPSVMALVEHELNHCRQAEDEYGAPRYNRATGTPIWTIKGHDVEEFTDVIERYGPEAAGPDVVAFVAAAQRPPTIARASLSGLCGTCLSRAA